MNKQEQLEICQAHDELQTAIEDLKQSRKNLIEKNQLQEEISIIENDIAELKGYTPSQFQTDMLHSLKQTWEATSFVCGNVLDLLDRYLVFISEPQTHKRITSKKRVRVLGVTSRN